MKQNGYALQFVSKLLQNDKEIVLEAMKQNGWALQYASKLLQNDREFILESMKQVKKSMNWPNNIFKVLEYGSENMIDESGNFLDLVFIRYLEPKMVSLFSTKKTYSTKLVLQLVMLNSIANYLKKSKTYDMNTGNINNDVEIYFGRNFMKRFLENTKQNLKSPINHKLLEKRVSELSWDLSLYGKHSDCIDGIIREWIDQDSFPSLESLNSVLNTPIDNSIPIIFELDRYVKEIQEKRPEYIVMSQLGSGGQGTVFKCYNQIEKRVDAIKIGVSTSEIDPNILKLVKVTNQFIVKMYEIGNFGDYLTYTIMEMGKESLSERVQSIHNNNLPVIDLFIYVIEIFIHVLYGVIFLHNHHITHRDLKLQNVIITSEDNKEFVKLIDFDSSKELQMNKSVTLTIGTFEYMAPELDPQYKHESKESSNFKISNQCDIFSLGCMLWKMLTNLPLELQTNGLNKKMSPFNFSNRSQYFYSVVKTHQRVLHCEINKVITEMAGPTLKHISDIIVRCLITMIQEHPGSRGSCATYLHILTQVFHALKHDAKVLDIKPELLKELLPSDVLDVELLEQQVETLQTENQQLQNSNKQLQNENQHLQKEAEHFLEFKKQMEMYSNSLTKDMDPLVVKEKLVNILKM